MIGARRGDLLSAADRSAGDQAGKPCPALALPADRFAETGSLLGWLPTSEAAGAVCGCRFGRWWTGRPRSPAPGSAADMLRGEPALVVTPGIG